MESGGAQASVRTFPAVTVVPGLSGDHVSYLLSSSLDSPYGGRFLESTPPACAVYFTIHEFRKNKITADVFVLYQEVWVPLSEREKRKIEIGLAE